MHRVLSFFESFFTDNQDEILMKGSLLVIIVAALVLALGICIAISKKNRLYIKSKKEEKSTV